MCGSVPLVTATLLPARSLILLIPLPLFVTRAVHSGFEYTYIAFIGIPFALPITEAAPAVDPKSILPPLRYSRALFDYVYRNKSH